MLSDDFVLAYMYVALPLFCKDQEACYSVHKIRLSTRFRGMAQRCKERLLLRVVASQALRMSHCWSIWYGIYSIVSGGQNNLSGGKRRLSGG